MTAGGPLDGIRIVDMTRIWAGPLATRVLADLGADVIKIEAPAGRGAAVVPPGRGIYPGGDPGERPWERQGAFNKLNRNKRSVAVDLKADHGKAVFLRLVAEADIVIENFSARAMPSLGLAYEALRAVNDAIIYVAMPAFGGFGPYRDYIGLGPSIEALTGLTAIMGYSEAEPRVTSKAITDAISGTATAAAVMTALERRARTGQGAYVDLSQSECGIAYVGEYFIERQLTGEQPEPHGNAHPHLAPHGVYRCAGDDQWIAITPRNEEEWGELAAYAERDWPDDARFATLASRIDHRDALNEAIEAWTVAHDKYALMDALQSRGVPAGAVQSSPEWLADRQLDARGFFVDLEVTGTGPMRFAGTPLVTAAGRGTERWTPAPGLGAHNHDVLGGLLGMSDEEIAGLESRGIIVDRPPG